MFIFQAVALIVLLGVAFAEPWGRGGWGGRGGRGGWGGGGGRKLVSNIYPEDNC